MPQAPTRHSLLAPFQPKVVYYRGASKRADIIGQAVLAGLARHGLTATIVDEIRYTGPEADIAVFYGLAGNLKRAQREYVAAGSKAVFVDLGYWGRFDGGKAYGFHRVVVNGLHATEYFQRVRHGPERFNRFRIMPRPFRKTGQHVMLCGMSAKSSWVYDLKAEAWERAAVKLLRAATARDIHYRPKPSWDDANPIEGTTWCRDSKMDIEDALGEAWACVSHHSNVSLDALIAGVPIFCADGIASKLARQSLADIEQPLYPDEGERDQLLYDAAYTQFKVSEIAEGTMWCHLMDEGLV